MPTLDRKNSPLTADRETRRVLRVRKGAEEDHQLPVMRYMVTAWIWPAPETGKLPTRTVYRVLAINPDELKRYITSQSKISYGSDAVVEFGPVGVSKTQGEHV